MYRRTCLLLAACLLALTGCSSLQGTGDKGYVSGDGQIRQVAAVDRNEPVTLRAPALGGGTIDLADYRGKVVVVAVWAAWCAPCRAEAPWLVEAAEKTKRSAQFVGIDIRDLEANAQAFVRNQGITYPSIFDPNGEALLAFPGTLGPQTIPAFVVLDREGRIAASIIGELPSRLTLVDLVEEVAAEDG